MLDATLRDHVVLFSWLHLSDIHIGQGNAAIGWDQVLVLQELKNDVVLQLREERVCRPAALFVTGDIAFSGATRQPDEYQRAGAWLSSVATAAELPAESVFVVPGNHDVQRNVDAADAQLGALVKAVRGGAESIDTVLRDPAHASLFRKRLANYLDFTGAFAPACREVAASAARAFSWAHERSVQGGLRLRVVGLNTALLAADDEDRGRLRLGGAQLAQIQANDPQTMLLTLGHHPLRGGWLADEDAVAGWIRNHSQVHLTGHVHEADATQVIKGGGGRSISVTAGACHGDAGALPSHGYNFAALARSPEGQLELLVWPRRWSPANAGFRLDVENVLDGQTHSRHVIGPAPARAPDAPAPRRAATPVDRMHKLSALLAGLSVTDTFAGRSALLAGIPFRDALNRDPGNKLLDLQQIVGALLPRKLADGTACVVTLIDNALPYAEGSDLQPALLALRASLLS
jgi:hypothetical protein